MPRFPETNEPTPETPSPERPPVLNECNCHRTGICVGGCGEQGGDSNDEDDGTSVSSLDTLVPSDSSETDGPDEDHLLLSANTEGAAGGAALSDVELPAESDLASDIYAFLARFRGSDDGFVLEPCMVIDFGQATFRPFSRSRYRDAGSPNSMRNERGTDEPRSSSASSGRRSRPLSPGPGMVAWADEALGLQLQLQEYLFTDRPLRLTPQRRYCRGLVASHLIVCDR